MKFYISVEYPHDTEDIKDHFDTLSDEWLCGIKGEVARVTTCLKLLHKELELNLTEEFDHFYEVFQNIYNEIQSRYIMFYYNCFI